MSKSLKTRGNPRQTRQPVSAADFDKCILRLAKRTGWTVARREFRVSYNHPLWDDVVVEVQFRMPGPAVRTNTPMGTGDARTPTTRPSGKRKRKQKKARPA